MEELLEDAFLDTYRQARKEVIRVAVRRKLLNDIKGDRIVDPYLRDAVTRLGKDNFLPVTVGKPIEWLVTVSAKDGIVPLKFWEQVSKCLRKVEFVGSTGEYCLEQRSEVGQEPYGWHAHIYVKLAKQLPKSKIVQTVYQCFKMYLAGQNYIDVRPVFAKDGIGAYMRGEKSADKMGKVAQDKVQRELLGIPALVSY